jgi:hypothetical protein
MKYANGDVYSGAMSDFMRNGLGEYCYSNGDVYVGSWAKGVRNGKGEIVKRSGATYNGTWKHDMMQGELYARNTKGDAYTLNFKSGKCDDEISVRFANGDSFKGQIGDAGYKKGVYTFADGTSYDGTWLNGRPDKVKVLDAQGKRVKGVSVYRNVALLDMALIKVQ